MQLIAAALFIPLCAYLNAATGSTLPSPFRVDSGDRWWSHWMTAIVQGVAIYALTFNLWLTAAFSIGWFVWRKPEFGYLLDGTRPETSVGRFILSWFGPDAGGQWIARWTLFAIPASCAAMLGGELIVAALLAISGPLVGMLYIRRAAYAPWLRECLSGGVWGVAGALSIIV